MVCQEKGSKHIYKGCEHITVLLPSSRCLLLRSGTRISRSFPLLLISAGVYRSSKMKYRIFKQPTTFDRRKNKALCKIPFVTRSSSTDGYTDNQACAPKTKLNFLDNTINDHWKILLVFKRKSVVCRHEVINVEIMKWKIHRRWFLAGATLPELCNRLRILFCRYGGFSFARLAYVSLFARHSRDHHQSIKSLLERWPAMHAIFLSCSSGTNRCLPRSLAPRVPRDVRHYRRWLRGDAETSFAKRSARIWRSFLLFGPGALRLYMRCWTEGLRRAGERLREW